MRRNRAPIENRKTQKLAVLRRSRQALVNRINGWVAINPAQEKTAAVEAAKDAVKSMAQCARNARTAMQRLAQKHLFKTQDYRAFQLEHGLVRHATMPDPLQAILIAVISILTEGSLTSVLLISGGHMDVIEGFAYGLTVAGTNVATGLTTGYFPARYAGYKVDAPEQTIRDRKVRILGQAGLALGLGVMATLHFVAARVRVTGEHSGIFNFDAIGFLDTFNDAFALSIIVVGAIGSILAFYKGYQGISDPVIGYTALRRECEDEIDTAAQDMAEDYLADVEEQFEAAAEGYATAIEGINTQTKGHTAALNSLRSDVAAHNTTVQTDIEQVHRDADAEHRNREFVEAKSISLAPIDCSAFEALIIDESTLPGDVVTGEPGTLPDMQTQLDAAYRQAMTDIRDALTSFRLSAPDIETFFNIIGESDA